LEENAQIGRRMLETEAEGAQSNGNNLREQVDRLEKEADTVRSLLADRVKLYEV
jgi:uncharacterized protein Yka (UPF0111/DUF47 family)